jgi:hypothetical protein
MIIRIVSVLIVLSISILILVNNRFPKVDYYNCEIAEFHPDYPIAVKEECRRIRSNAKRVTV